MAIVPRSETRGESEVGGNLRRGESSTDFMGFLVVVSEDSGEPPGGGFGFLFRRGLRLRRRAGLLRPLMFFGAKLGCRRSLDFSLLGLPAPGQPCRHRYQHRPPPHIPQPKPLRPDIHSHRLRWHLKPHLGPWVWVCEGIPEAARCRGVNH